ncbi:hypothetical protein H5410_005894 [Solanum commersonii]|uniref:Uncharacterized protein n=1 Tax=Solanum commersonii TaxID=4109 RepID=A0A9J6A8S1_SOLCO|nr:hypothetical protein H5410_005894 [Solanum commersonii]
MMMKCLWRYNLGEAGLCKDVILAKHGRLNQWCTDITTPPYGVGLWKAIREDFLDLFRIAQDPNPVIAANREGTN